MSFLRAWRDANSLAKTMLKDLEPHAVLGLGGFAAGPLVQAAAKKSIPTAMLNPDSVPGKANRFLAKRVDVIFTQFSSTADCFVPELRSRISTVGCPVRPGLLDGTRAEALEYFPNLREDRKTLLVFGGSKLAESITDAFITLADDFDRIAEQWQLLLVVGAGRLDEVRRAYENRKNNVAGLEYCQRMDLAYALADLAVCRGGAGTIAELTATGTPAVILPYPHHQDRQQYLNPAELVQAGAAKIVEDLCNPAENAKALRTELFPILNNSDILEEMQSRAQASARPHVAKDIATWLASGR